MRIIDIEAKQIMEDFKQRCRDFGLEFTDKTLEYWTTNEDMIFLAPKNFIPSLYDHWYQDVRLLQGQGMYRLRPHNPLETVINTRPPISYYNHHNLPYMYVFLSPHVLTHIHLFQNNIFFKNTWGYDFYAHALEDKRRLAKLREQKGADKRWVDYVMEFTMGIDNLVGYYSELKDLDQARQIGKSETADYYFHIFLSAEAKLNTMEYMEEFEKYNRYIELHGAKKGEEVFFEEVKKKYLQFSARLEKYQEKKKQKGRDIIQHIMGRSELINKPKNKWMKIPMQVIRDTSLYFQAQIRTKIVHEGAATLIHQLLAIEDPRMKGHEFEFSVVNARVTLMPRVGINPYALGCVLLQYMWELADKGKLKYDFQRLNDAKTRAEYDQKTGKGKEFFFEAINNFDDFLLVNFLSEKDFQDFVNKHKLYVTGRRLDLQKRVWQYYIKSRKGEDYRKMILNQLYHPPHIFIDEERTVSGELYLNHVFESKSLITKFIPNTMLGIEYLWGGPVKLETTEFEVDQRSYMALITGQISQDELEYEKKRVLYTMENRELTKEEI